MSTPSFRELLGMEAARAELRRDLAADRLVHAYLFEGRTGTGRCCLARAFAANLFCEAREGEDACGRCRPCRMLAGGNHPDYLELPRDVGDLRKGRFVGEDGGSETTGHEPVLRFLGLRPMVGARRVCCIPDAERMRVEAANAFLKSLEEPPAGTVILLTAAAREQLLPTIVSRCRRIHVPPLPAETLEAALVRREAATAGEAAALAVLAEGSLGLALALAEGETLEDWRWMDETLRRRLAPAEAVRFSDGLIERMTRRGKDAAARRAAARRLLDLLALRVRRSLREGLAPHAGARALGVLWEAGEQILANVRTELVLRVAALECMAALKQG